MKRRALFLDRDGTLTYPFHYPSRPEHLRLYEDIGPVLRVLQNMDFRLVVITNQAGIARGYFTHTELAVLHHYLAEELAKQGVTIDAIYHCPHHPEGQVPEFAIRCNCRKPQAGMLLQAAQDLDINLARSWFIGDILDDIEAGNRAGCRSILVDLGTEQVPSHPLRQPTFVASDTRHALEIVKTVEEVAPTVDLVYRPSMWLVPLPFFRQNAAMQTGPRVWYPQECSTSPDSLALEGQATYREGEYARKL